MVYKRLLSSLLLLALLAAPSAYSAVALCRTLPEELSVAQGTKVTIPLHGAKLFRTPKQTQAVYSADAAQNTWTAETDGITLDTSATGSYDVEFKLFGILPMRKVSVNVYQGDRVIPGGETLGIKIYTDGVLVVALTSITDTQGVSCAPATDAGLRVGDVLLRVNGQKIVDADHFSDMLAALQATPVNIEYVRSGEKYTVELMPVFTQDGYKIGAWVRDSTAGLGTLTFVRPDKGVYAALGHGIADIDTAQLLSVLDGSVSKCEISSVVPGKKGSPGQLHGAFTEDTLGSILQNSNVGIYGAWKSKILPEAESVKVASRFEIHEGEAKIRFAPDGQTPAEYSVQIERILTASADEKGMIVKVTDPELLRLTGGIVQGMSGSPILQDGRLIGAVTHVFVNDPTRGYGIFAELMMDSTEKVMQ